MFMKSFLLEICLFFHFLVCVSAMFHIASCAFLARSILKASTVFVTTAIRIFFPSHF